LPSGTLVVGGRVVVNGTMTGAAFRSRDGGKTFEPWPAAPRVRALAQRDGMLYIAADNTRDGFALAVSPDEGTTITPLMRYADVSAIKACVAQTCGQNCRYEAGLGVWASSTCGASGNSGAGGSGGGIDQPQGCACSIGVISEAGLAALAAEILLSALLLRRRSR
jgi:hypothetical protein